MQTANCEVFREPRVVVKERNIDASGTGVLNFAIDESNIAMAQIASSNEVEKIRGEGKVDVCSDSIFVTGVCGRYRDGAPRKDVGRGADGSKVRLGSIRDNVGRTTSEGFYGLLIETSVRDNTETKLPKGTHWEYNITQIFESVQKDTDE